MKSVWETGKLIPVVRVWAVQYLLTLRGLCTRRQLALHHIARGLKGRPFQGPSHLSYLGDSSLCQLLCGAESEELITIIANIIESLACAWHSQRGFICFILFNPHSSPLGQVLWPWGHTGMSWKGSSVTWNLGPCGGAAVFLSTQLSSNHHKTTSAARYF